MQMGWWKIDPDSGAPAKDAHSALSRPPDFVLLNAVPGVDGEDAAFYLGDGPWDMASTVPAEIESVIGVAPRLSDDQIRDLLLRRVVPPDIAGGGPEIVAKLLQVVDALWKDIDGCYKEDWERPARPAEKRWVCEYVLASRKARST
jgi:hypothetical protein